jgi:thiamine-phosphate pyrophosphorylase
VLGPNAVVGATCRTPEAGRAAVADGAGYLGVGPAFATSSKDGLPPPLGPGGIGAVVDAVPGTPVIAIGGITADRAPELPGYGVAAISAIARDPAAGTIALLKALASRGDLEELR